MKFKSIGDFVAIKLLEEDEATESGIIVSAIRKKSRNLGRVISDISILKNPNNPLGIRIRKGEIIAFVQDSAVHTGYNGQDVYFVHASNIMGVFEAGEDEA